MSTPAAGPWTKFAQQQGPWSKYAQSSTSGLTPEALAANKARNAEPTQFEKDRAGDTAVSNVINQVTHPLQPNPHANANSPWFEQANGQQAGQPFSLNKLLDSPAGKAAHEANVNAARFGADTLGGAEIARPFAALAESHVLPALKSLPYAGKVISTIDEAPGILGKVTRGAAVGGAAGGTEGLIRGHGVAGSAEDALKGAGYGAAGGLILPGIHKLSGVEPIVPERPAYGPETPTEGQFRRSAKIGSAQAAEAEAAKPVFPGASLPSASEFYENRGAELNKIRKMQPQEPPVEAEKPSFVGAPLPSAEDFYSNRGEDISRAMKQQPEAFTPKSIEQPTFPGAHLPDVGEFYENRGSELNKIRSMNEALQRRQPTPEPELGSPENPGFHAKLPTRMPKISTPSGGPTATPEGVQLPQQDVIRVPEPRAKFPGEKEGYNASTPRRLVLDNAMQGRPGAAEMLRNMGKTPLFVPEGGYAPPKESFKMGSPVSLGEGEDLGPGFGTQHTIQKNGNRIGSVTVEPKGEGNLHVHWLGGDLADNGVTRTHVVNSLKEQYPGTENITYDRRRLAKGDTAATTEPRSMKISGPGE